MILVTHTDALYYQLYVQWSFLSCISCISFLLGIYEVLSALVANPVLTLYP